MVNFNSIFYCVWKTLISNSIDLLDFSHSHSLPFRRLLFHISALTVEGRGQPFFPTKKNLSEKAARRPSGFHRAVDLHAHRLVFFYF